MANSNGRWRIFGLRTRAQRGFLVLLIALLAGFNTYYAMTERIIHPTEWYFYTVSSDGIDIRTPTGRSLIRGTIMSGDWAQQHATRCANLTYRIIGMSQHGVWLCNTGGFTGEEFQARRAYFVVRVDEMYADYYREVIERTVWATALAIGAWLLCLALYGVGLWVMRGR